MPHARHLPAMFAAVALAGCASPAPPRPPSLHLPAAAHHVSASRTGDTVALSFSAPVRTTDGVSLPANTPLEARACREFEHAPCNPILAQTKVLPGHSAVLEDRLPGTLSAGPARLLGYRLELLNAKGRSAGMGDIVFAAAGAAPAAVRPLTATGTRLGVLLRWPSAPSGEIYLTRTEAGVAKPLILRPENGGDPGQLLDTSAKEAVAYTYTAHREATSTLGSRKLVVSGAISSPVSFTLRDVFPPPAPTNATAAPFTDENGHFAVDLIWNPIDDPTFAGYNLYREAPAEPRHKLNATPLPTASFHDATAQNGVAYTWRITAIDKHGNESAPAVISIEK